MCSSYLESKVQIVSHASSPSHWLEAKFYDIVQNCYASPHVEIAGNLGNSLRAELDELTSRLGLMLLGSCARNQERWRLFGSNELSDASCKQAHVMVYEPGHLTVVAESEEDAKKLFRLLMTSFGDLKSSVENCVAVNVTWYSGAFTSEVAAPAWSDIADNYPLNVRRQLANIICKPPSDNSGRIMIFNGAAGTGKTFAVRALAMEWRDYAAAVCVADPERFFTDTEYLMKVLKSEQHDPRLPEEFRILDLDWHNYHESVGNRPKLVILEDVDELVSIDAKTIRTQAVSRVLNIADGILGQAMDCYLLMTANNDVNKLQSALTRPGRCRAAISFECFNHEEALRWLESRGTRIPDDDSRRQWTLAELFSLLAKARSKTGQS